ncbi:MAG: transketolase [Muribaculaceae bacterium]|nr:transketolase [Muribaculaceae bacterium]
MEKSTTQYIDSHDTFNFAKEAKILALKLVNRANSSHIGGSLSIADVLAVLFNGVLKLDPKNPKSPERDFLIYSKAHCSSIYYAVLGLKNFFSTELLEDFCKEGSIFTEHINCRVPGVEYGGGSLGHGLPVACGIALAIKKQGKSNQVYCIVSDGEMEEGSTWEAILFASQQNLSNLTLIIDFNKIQALGKVVDILNLENIENKFQSFGWECLRIDGHNHKEIIGAFQRSHSELKPLAIVCDTIKGKGVSFMENNLKYHYSSPNEEELKSAIKEIENETYIYK